MNALTYGTEDAEAAHESYSRITLSSLAIFFSLLTLSAALQISDGLFQSKALAAVSLSVVFCVAAFIVSRSALLLPFSRQSALRRGFFALLTIYFLAGAVGLRFRHVPIDVTILETDSARSLIHGADPYGKDVTHVDIYTSRSDMYGPGVSVNGRVRLGFPYPPLTLLWILPGYAAGDVRLSFLLAIVLTAAMIFLNEPNLNGLVAAVLFMFVPATPFVLKCGWTEPLMVMTLAGTVLAARRRPAWLPVALGLFFASKQYALLAVPLAALLLPAFSWRAYTYLLAKAGAVASIITLPFLLWDPKGFWWSLVGFRLLVPLRLDALSFSSLLARHNFRPVPEWFVLLAVLAATVFALKTAPKTAAGFSVSVALVSLIFFVLNIGAFCNYYFFCAGALCLGISGDAYDSGQKVFGIFPLPQLSTQQDMRPPRGIIISTTTEGYTK